MTQALEWQRDIWDRLSQTYADTTDRLFEPLVHRAVERAAPVAGEALLDVGCGTGSVAVEAARHVGPDGLVLGVDPSPRMLERATARGHALGLRNVRFVEGTAEEIPADPGLFDVVVASLSLMYVIDREAAAAECTRVLRRGGRFVGVVWAAAEHADIVRFQNALAALGPPPPAAGVGPDALADPTPFLRQLGGAGIDAEVEAETFGFEVGSFAVAWEVMAEVTASRMTPDARERAKAEIRKAMWPDGDGPRTFTNRALFITGRKR